MRNLLTAISFASLTLAGIGIATALSDVRISEAQVADIRIDFPFTNSASRTTTLSTGPIPKVVPPILNGPIPEGKSGKPVGWRFSSREHRFKPGGSYGLPANGQ